MPDAQQSDPTITSKLAGRRTHDQVQVWGGAVMVAVMSVFVCVVYTLRRPWHNSYIAIFVVCAVWLGLCGWVIPRRALAARSESTEAWLRLGEPGWDQQRLRVAIRRNAVWALLGLGGLVGGLVAVYVLARVVS